VTLTIDQPTSHILVINYIGELDLTEHSAAFEKTVAPACESVEPAPLHVIHNLEKLDIDFGAMVKWMETMQTRRTGRLLPYNMKQYFIGHNQWAESLTRWMEKQDGLSIPIFNSLDAALAFLQQEH